MNSDTIEILERDTETIILEDIIGENRSNENTKSVHSDNNLNKLNEIFFKIFENNRHIFEKKQSLSNNEEKLNVLNNYDNQSNLLSIEEGEMSCFVNDYLDIMSHIDLIKNCIISNENTVNTIKTEFDSINLNNKQYIEQNELNIKNIEKKLETANVNISNNEDSIIQAAIDIETIEQKIEQRVLETEIDIKNIEKNIELLALYSSHSEKHAIENDIKVKLLEYKINKYKFILLFILLLYSGYRMLT